MKILVLTKNVLVERELQQQLQELNYEVLCSTIEFYQLLHSSEYREIDEVFDVVIPSHMLTSTEVACLEHRLEGQHVVLLLDFCRLTMEQKREKLYTVECELARDSQMEKNTNYIYSNQNRLTVEEFIDRLSSNERNLFQILFQNFGSPVSREELCQELWGNIPNNSNLVQLSNITKRIRKKIEDSEMNFTIQVIWGRGYLLYDR